MPKLCRVFGLILACTLVASAAFADGAGSSGAGFMKLAVGARPAAMGEAYSALADDAVGQSWNPAGLPDVDYLEASFTHLAWLEDITYDNLSLAVPIGGAGAGLSLNYLNVPPFNSTLDDNAPKASANDFSGQLSLGLPLFGRALSAGAAVKAWNSNLAGENSMGGAADLGLLWKPLGRSLNAALVVQNLGAATKVEEENDPLPMDLRLGVAWRLWDRDQNTANLALDAVKPLDNRIRYNLGVEWWPVNLLALRAGYKLSEGGQDMETKLDDPSRGANYTAGLGFRLGAFQADYAYTPLGELGRSHRLSASWKFGHSPEPVAGEDMLSEAPRFMDNAQAVAFRFTQPKRLSGVKRWRLEVTDARGAVVRTLWGDGQPGDIVWDGRDEGGRAIDAGQPVAYRLWALDGWGRGVESKGPITQVLRPRDLLAGGPKLGAGGTLTFKPKADLAVGVKEWSLTLKAPDGTLLKTVSGTGPIPKTLNLEGAALGAGGVNLLKAKGVSQIQYALQFKTETGASRVIADRIDLAAQEALAETAALPLMPREYRVNPGREVLVLPIPGMTSALGAGAGQAEPFSLKVPVEGQAQEWKLEVTDPAGRAVKTFQGKGQPPESVFWDGRGDDGAPVPRATDCRFSLWAVGQGKPAARSTAGEVVRQPFTLRSAQGEVRRVSGLWFRLRDVDVDPRIAPALAHIADIIKRNPGVQVTIQGHAFAEGSAADMMRLSQERADAVLRYLIEVEGVSPRNISAIGYADAMPLNAKAAGEDAAQNRRVDVLIINR